MFLMKTSLQINDEAAAQRVDLLEIKEKVANTQALASTPAVRVSVMEHRSTDSVNLFDETKVFLSHLCT